MSALTNMAESLALEAEYNEALAAHRNNPTPETRRLVDLLGLELFNARAHWRAVGEALHATDPTAPGARTIAKVIEVGE